MVLIDDLSAELDTGSRDKLLAALVKTPAQHWMSSIEPLTLPMFNKADIRSYGIRAGKVLEMVY